MKPSPPDDVRLRKLEQRVNLLLLLGVCQTVMLIILLIGILINQLIPGTSTLILLALGGAVIIYLLRSQIPGWFRSLSQRLFARLRAAEKSHSYKDR